MSNLVILGPMGAGKTAQLAAIHVAALKRRGDVGRIRLLPKSRPMADLISLIPQALNNGQLPIKASQAITEYDFEMIVKPPSGAWRSRLGMEREYSFRFVDGPGEALLPGSSDTGVGRGPVDPREVKQFREGLVTELSRAEGIVICVDSMHRRNRSVFWQQLPPLLNEVHSKTGRRTLPAKRIVICLTKADAYFQGHGRGAHGKVQRSDPTEAAHELMSGDAVLALRDWMLPRARLGFVWTSAFGFIPGDGSANFNPSSQGLAVTLQVDDDSDLQADKCWDPYQVIDPLLFVATGEEAGTGVRLART